MTTDEQHIIDAGRGHLIDGRPREARTTIRGSGSIKCDDPNCTYHREKCLFGEHHSWSVWFESGRLQRTAETLHCHKCGGVCIAEESA